MKYRLGIVTKNGLTIGNNFDTRKEMDDFILEIAERFGVKYYKIIDRETREIIITGRDL